MMDIASNEDLSDFSKSRKMPQIRKKTLSENKEFKSRVRSASTGRDKKSEFQARYWSFIFKNLQRAVDEIYKTVEYYENLASCQETILVLENYIRDFKALAEFFQMNWDYEKTPMVQRQKPLAWEIRKTNAMPRIVRNKNISPALSGKSSPNCSGHNSPWPTIEENKLSILSPTKVKNRSQDFTFPSTSKTGKRGNLEDYQKISSNPDDIKTTEEKEKQFEQMLKDSYNEDHDEEEDFLQRPKSLSLENLKEMIESSAEGFDFFNRNEMVRNGRLVFDNSSQTEGLIEDSLTWLDYLIKYCGFKVDESSEIDDPVITNENSIPSGKSLDDSSETLKEEPNANDPSIKLTMRDWNEEMMEEELQKTDPITGKSEEIPMVNGLDVSENEIVEDSKTEVKNDSKHEEVVENSENISPNCIANNDIKEIPIKSDLKTDINQNLENQIIENSQEIRKSEISDENSKNLEEEKHETIIKNNDDADSGENSETIEKNNVVNQKTGLKETYSQKVSGGVPKSSSKTDIVNVKAIPPANVIQPPPTIPPQSSNPLKRPLSVPSKPFIKPGNTARQVYSLRNQTIPSTNAPKRPLSNTQPPKRTTFSAPVNRNSTVPRTSSYNNPNKHIPAASNKTAVLNTQKPKNCDTMRSHFPVRSKTMIEMPNKKSLVNNQRVRGLLPQKSTKDESDSSTSTLKASTEVLGSKNSVIERKVRKSNEKLENDGWLTVKTKRRSSLHWSTRFDQPSSSTSLPSLTLLNENGEDVSKEPEAIGDSKEKNAKYSIPPKKTNSETVGSKVVKNDKVNDRRPKMKMDSVRPQSAKNPATTLEKSKSTLASTSFKSRSQPVSKFIKVVNNNNNNHTQSNNKINDKTNKPTNVPASKNNNNVANGKSLHDNIILRQKSDLTGLKIKSLRKEYLRSSNARNQKLKNQKLLEEEQNIDRSEKNIQTTTNPQPAANEETEKKIFNGDFSSCDELEDKEETESDEDQKKLLEEQESLERQIRELENTEIDVDTETETDCEAIIDFEDNESSTENNDLNDNDQNLFFNEDITLEMRYAPMLQEMSTLERAEILATLQNLVARYPGRAQKLHQKLSSPSRSRSFHETLKKYQEKQSRAEEKRQELYQKRALKIQQLLARVEDVKTAKQQLIDKKRHRMEERLKRAAENRDQYLKNKVKKAHDEEEKLKEIAFIKNLEAQNRRIEFMESCKENEVRLQDLEQERIKKAEEKAAKEAAVERRRLELEMERVKKLERLNETRREREQRVGKMQEQKEKMRQEMAKEKQRDRDKRLQMLQKQQLQDTQDLQKRIAQKQQESARRHEENIEHIRQKALELASQRNPEETVKTVVEDEENTNIGIRSKEAIKIGKKKMKKIKQKFVDISQKYLAELPALTPKHRKDSQIPKLLVAISKGNAGGSNGVGVERPIGQILRIVEKSNVADFQCLWLLDGLGILAKVIEEGLQPNSEITEVAVTKAVQLYRNGSSSCTQIARHSILGGTFFVLLDALAGSLKISDDETTKSRCPVAISTEILLACTVVLSNIKPQESPQIAERLGDVISYIVASGIGELITRKCYGVREPIENQQSLLLPLLAMIGFLTKVAEICPKDEIDLTKFITVVKSTEIFGTISLLYSTVVPSGESIPPRTISLAGSICSLLKTIAGLDVITFQGILAGEKLTFKFLDVVTILLNYCSPKVNENRETKAVIIDLIQTLGYFCANNKKNQNLLTSEQSYIILKSLTKLPSEFDPYIYPTLVTVVWENQEARGVLCKDFDCELLMEFKKSEYAKKNKLINLLEL